MMPLPNSFVKRFVVLFFYYYILFDVRLAGHEFPRQSRPCQSRASTFTRRVISSRPWVERR